MSRQIIPEMLVPFDGSHAAEQLVLARLSSSAHRCRRRDRARRGEDRRPVALDELPDDLDGTVLHALIRAQDICRDERVAATFELTHARNLAEAIIEEAERTEASLICLSMEEHVPGEDRPDEPQTSSPCSRRPPARCS